jgi:DNA-binding XRE family transcriptional regulator
MMPNSISVIVYDSACHYHAWTNRASTLNSEGDARPEGNTQRIGERVRTLREKTGLSQEDFAYERDFGRSFMSSIENGKKDLRLSTLCKLADVFGMSLSQFLKGVDS